MIKKELTKSEAKEKALRLLGFRAHSEKELKLKLIRAGANEEDIPSIMDFLKEYGFINDGEYARHLAADLKNIKKYGKNRILGELISRGISRDLAENAVSELEDDEQDTLLPLIERRLGGNFEKKNTEKAIRYFLYRGYDYDDIKKCLEKIESEMYE